MRTILADGEPSVRRALRVLLTQDLDMQVVCEISRADVLARRVREVQPDLLVVDWELVADEGATALAGLRRLSPGLHVVVLSLRPEARVAALTAGADGFASKLDPPEETVRALRAFAPRAPVVRPGRRPARQQRDGATHEPSGGRS